MADDRMVRPIEVRRKVSRRQRDTDRVPHTLAQGSRRGLDSGRDAALGVTRRPTLPLSECSEVVEGEIVPGEVERRVQQHGCVSAREDEAITTWPVGIGRVVAQVLRPDDEAEGRIGDRKHSTATAPRQAGVSALPGRFTIPSHFFQIHAHIV